MQTENSIPDVATDPDPARFRTLVADTAGVEATANWTTQLSEGGPSLSLNATYERSDRLRLQGKDEAAARSGGYGGHGYDPAADCAQSLELFRRG